MYEQEAGNDEEKEIVPTPISAQEKVQRAQKTAKAHVKPVSYTHLKYAARGSLSTSTEISFTRGSG